LHSLTGVLPVNAVATTTIPSGGSEDIAANSTEKGIETPPSFAGYTSHTPLRIATKYYTADVPIWVDEIPFIGNATGHPPGTTPALTAVQWKAEFLSSEARVVRDAIGAALVCVQNPDAAPSGVLPFGKEEHAAEVPGGPVPASMTESLSDREDVRALKDLLKAVSEVKSQAEEERGEIGDVPGLLVLVGKQQQSVAETEEAAVFSAEWWEDELYEMGVMGFEVVVWDPTANASDAEKRRNRFGGLFPFLLHI
jgi:hypothetical protein